ncbi:uncharacterized protein ACWYII_023172 isoform 2-T3 [Salvelinus alpinus]
MEPQSFCTQQTDGGVCSPQSSLLAVWARWSLRPPEMSQSDLVVLRNFMSFMGKGVVKNTVICLLHLSHQMMAQIRARSFSRSFSRVFPGYLTEFMCA